MPLLAHVRCAVGGTGVSRPGYFTIMLYFDVVAASELHGLRVLGIEIFDAAGAAIARAVPPTDLRLSLPGRDQDHNLITAPFNGSIDAGGSVRLVASAQLTPIPGGYRDMRYCATLSTTPTEADAMRLIVDGSVDDSWPTAGPALR